MSFRFREGDALACEQRRDFYVFFFVLKSIGFCNMNLVGKKI